MSQLPATVLPETKSKPTSGSSAELPKNKPRHLLLKGKLIKARQEWIAETYEIAGRHYAILRWMVFFGRRVGAPHYERAIEDYEGCVLSVHDDETEASAAANRANVAVQPPRARWKRKVVYGTAMVNEAAIRIHKMRTR